MPVVTTSGTATANLHPAVLEAAHSGAPLLVLTADRPPELRGTGANQTVDQVGLYGAAVRLFAEVGTPAERAGDNAYWRSLTCRALAAAHGTLDGRPGPVHLNLGLREPLTPDDAQAWVEPLAGRDAEEAWTSVLPPPAAAGGVDDLPARTLVILGDGPAAAARAALNLAEVRGFPVVAEPSAGASDSPNTVVAAELLLGVPEFLSAHRPDRVLVVGRPTLSRAVGRLAAGSPCDVVAAMGGWPDPSRTAARVLPAVPEPGTAAAAPEWLSGWLDAGQQVAAAVDDLLAAQPTLTEPAVAAVVAGAAPGLLVVGSSKPVRDLFLAGTPAGTRVLANRGAAGIDGMVSTAVGAALAHAGPSVALLGDLTFLHDSNGLVLGPSEPRPDLTVVVVHNDGGAIFGLLEQGADEHAGAFERMFGTPHGVDLQALCAATGTPWRRVDDRAGLREALAAGGGIRVVEVRTDRVAAVDLDRALRVAAARSLGGRVVE